MRRNFGRFRAIDRRDAKHRLAVPRTSRRSRYWNAPIWFDQGTKPICVGAAWARWLRIPPHNQWVDPEGLYTLAQLVDEWEGTDYEGTSVRAGAKVLHRLGAIEAYKWARSVSEIIAFVLEFGPMVVGTDWHEGMEEPDHRGRVTADGENLGGHAYVLSGVNRDREEFRIDNSWGQQWGNGGRATISFADFAKLLKRDGEACVGVEKRLRGAA